MFTAALFRIDKIWKQPKCLSQIKKIQYTVFSHSFVSDSLRPNGLAAPQASPVHHQLLELAQTHVH